MQKAVMIVAIITVISRGGGGGGGDFYCWIGAYYYSMSTLPFAVPEYTSSALHKI